MLQGVDDGLHVFSDFLCLLLFTLAFFLLWDKLLYMLWREGGELRKAVHLKHRGDGEELMGGLR